SRMLARRLGYRYLDTGALYRAVAWAARAEGISPDDDSGLGRISRSLHLRIIEDGLVCNGLDITEAIRAPRITMLASAVSARPVVRQSLMAVQRDMGRQKGLVAEGRDMGTVVFPEADLKFFLDATVRRRALRRLAQYGPEHDQSLARIETDIRRRDENDRGRRIAPLKPADDAVVVDSTEMTANEVVDLMMDKVRRMH
ncbi:MAG: (d)CMP kinase, partial [Desulfosarcina sp.]